MEKSAGVKLSPDGGSGVRGIGEHELRYTRCGDDVCNGVAKATSVLSSVTANAGEEGNVAATRGVTMTSSD